MSQAHATNSENKNHFGINNHKPKFKNAKGRNRYHYTSRFPYYNNYMGFHQPRWDYFNWRRPVFRRPPLLKTPEKPRPKSPSPGTEEYNLKKIQETSDMIKKRLLMPPETSTENSIESEKDKPPVEIDKNNEVNNKKNNKCDSEKTVKPTKKPIQYNVEEIHNKIVTHITNLNYGKKMNLICATSSGYDEAIHQIQKQKRLELSKVLRDMCSNQTNSESSEVINSIIPDIGIKIEDLPLEVIQKLSSTLDFNFDDVLLPIEKETVKIKTEICDKDESVPNYPMFTNIKVEKDTDDEVDNNVNECEMDTTGNMVFSSDIPPYNDAFDHSVDSKNIISTNCVSTQTDSIIKISNNTQTNCDVIDLPFSVENEPRNLDEAVKTMFDIDKEIARLTELRQSIFLKLQSKSSVNNIEVKNEVPLDQVETKEETQTINETTEYFYKKEIDLDIHSEKILVVKVFKETLIAGSESGKIFYINVNTGQTVQSSNLGEFPITAFCFWKTLTKRPHVFISSFDNKITEFEFYTQRSLRLIKINEGVQCMELAWEFIFIGTVGGNLLRYSLKKFKIEFEEKISEDRILVLKATVEGGRPVLLVGTKNYPVCVRDAMSGLHMRTMNDIVTPTVYSLLLENSLVYCGTTFHDILVYRFHDGTLFHKYQGSNSKGVGCMKIVKNLLFASCYDGNIYVYNTKTREFVGVIQGPGGVILSMEIQKNLVIVGTMSFNFKSLLIPDYILESKSKL